MAGNELKNSRCSSEIKEILYIYRRGLRHFGDPMWWPGDSPWEIALGAVLTQNTSWRNVERALRRMREFGIFTPEEIISSPHEKLASAIRPSGYYNQKAKKLKVLSQWVLEQFGGDLTKAREMDAGILEKMLVSLWGIGMETADSIILYALDMPVFVVDRYTVRILTRYGVNLPESYEGSVVYLKRIMEESFSRTQFLNRLHALFVLLGKNYCRRRPLCEGCPLRERCAAGKSLKGVGGSFP